MIVTIRETVVTVSGSTMLLGYDTINKNQKQNQETCVVGLQQ